ncbi:MAG: penicillin-binding protein 2 [Eubacterium sp.]|nr:penicillin-binding protein 2 [Eubacterium sp.]
MRKKNREYVKNSKPKLTDRMRPRKSNRDYVMEQQNNKENNDRLPERGRSAATGRSLPGNMEDDDSYSDRIPGEVPRTPRGDLSRVEKIEGMFVPKSGKRLRTNRYMLYTSFLILLLFGGLIFYLARFTTYEAEAIITSPYNKRSSSLAQNVRRGSIKSANDKVLAETGIDDDGEEYRYYPYEDIFAHAVGYANHGKAGVESAYNYELMTSHERLIEQFKQGIRGRKNIGDTVVTTLDTRLQKRAYEALGSRRGAILAIEPKTGKVRAMVSKPDFDPNTLDADWEDINAEENNSCLLNRCVQGLYPPGSTYKILTALEYIEENPGSYQKFTYRCKGEDIVNSVHISCYGGQSHGEEDLSKAFAKSCNTAFVQIGSRLNLNRFINLNRKFLFDSKIDFDLTVKQSRFGLNSRSEKSDIPQTSIGQGNTLMTPMHNALIMCAIANDGVLIKPSMVDRIESADGVEVSRTKVGRGKRLADESDAKILQKLLRTVVTEGTGYAVNTDRYTAAGKTGTAENSGDGDHSWFVGYSNVEDPDLVVCVIVENGGAGSEVAAPIADELFSCYYDNEMYRDYRDRADDSEDAED